MKNYILTIIITIVPFLGAKAQLSDTEKESVKATANEFFKNMSELAVNPKNDDAFAWLIESFTDETNGEVYNDLRPGESTVPFIEYLGVLKYYEGALAFSYENVRIYAFNRLGLKFGLVEVDKTISGGMLKTSQVKNVLIINLLTGKISEISWYVPEGAILIEENEKKVEIEPVIIKKEEEKPKVEEQVSEEPAEIIKDPPWLDMVFVEGGTYNMGDKKSGLDASYIHAVKVDDFYMGKYEVTQKQWKMVMGNNPSEKKDCDDCPVENITWKEAVEFTDRLSQMTGLNYRLPTEAEWEYAARGGRKSKGFKYAGSDKYKDVASKGGYGFPTTKPVGQKKPNELGIHDMSGNVWEICSDWYDEDYYEESPRDNPKGPRSGRYKVIRGGGDTVSSTKITERNNSEPPDEYISKKMGLRLVRN